MGHHLAARTSSRLRRRPDRWVRAAAAVAAAGGLAACGTQLAPLDPGAGTPSAATPLADVADSGADCLTDDVVASVTGMPQDTGHPGAAAGSVPADFAPVHVVLCRVSWDLLEPEPPTLVPYLDSSDPEAIADVPEPEESERLQSFTVEEVTLTGDLAPLLAALARPSAPPSNGACMAMYEFQPVIFLVDAAGRAVRPQWPVDGCGFLHDGALDALASLTQADSTVHRVERCVDGCATEED